MVVEIGPRYWVHSVHCNIDSGFLVADNNWAMPFKAGIWRMCKRRGLEGNPTVLVAF